MRIIAGQFRSVPLVAVGKGDAAAHLRPTSDRVRESLFNLLTGYDPFEDAHILDLFAGTGALGLEALSRGAAHATFVDQGRVAQRLLRENIAKLQVKGQTKVMALDARRLPPCGSQGCSLVFLDPPYGKGLGLSAIQQADQGGWITPGGLVVWEDSDEMAAPPGFAVEDHRTYGGTHITIMSKTSR